MEDCEDAELVDVDVGWLERLFASSATAATTIITTITTAITIREIALCDDIANAILLIRILEVC